MNIFRKILQILFLLPIPVLLLIFPSQTLEYAKKGLIIWYQNMIPALLPMMIISGCMIKLNLTGILVSLIHPITKWIFHLSKNGTYAMIIGFLCGFPMGSKVICEMYSQNKISKEEAEILLPVCNNIGPVYLLTYGLNMLESKHIFSLIILFYVIPLVYAFFMLKTKHFSERNYTKNNKLSFSLALDTSISESASSLLSLAGYLIIFNIYIMIPMDIFPLSNSVSVLFACLLEITNGLSYPSALPPYIYLSLLQFGGLCCFFQTQKFVLKTNLGFKNYVFKKILLSFITLVFFYICYDVFFVGFHV